MPEGPSSHRPEKRLKTGPEHDLDSPVLSIWPPGNMVHPSYVQGFSALLEDSTVKPSPSNGLGSISNPNPALLQSHPSLPGYLETDWGDTESSIDHNQLLKYIKELEGLIGYQG